MSTSAIPYVRHIVGNNADRALYDSFGILVAQMQGPLEPGALRDQFFDLALHMHERPELCRATVVDTLKLPSPVHRIPLNGYHAYVYLFIFMGLVEINESGYLHTNQAAVSEGMRAAQARAQVAREAP